MTAFDIAVLGGGPSGAAAAAFAAANGARTVLIDEGIFGSGPAIGRAELRRGCVVWGVSGGGQVARGEPDAPFRLDCCDAGGVWTVAARALILCVGAHERIIPFEGWTLPGVIGLAAATVLNTDGVLPGGRTVVCGAGPLLAPVAAGIAANGGDVVAFVDILSDQHVARAYGSDRVSAVDVMSHAGGTPQRVACDSVCVGYGLVPASEAARLCGARHRYDPERGGWVPVLDDAQRSSVALLYVAGDAAGIAGEDAAALSGEIAARAALADLGREAKGDATSAIDELKRARTEPSFPVGTTSHLADRFDAIPPDCVVCPCEDLTRADLETAIALGARDLNQLKQFTRCGMGACQGRICGEAAAELLARAVGGRQAAGIWTARVPLRPVPVAALIDDFDYADIPVPAPAPI